MLEYVLLLALITIVAAIAVTAFGQETKKLLFDTTIDFINKLT